MHTVHSGQVFACSFVIGAWNDARWVTPVGSDCDAGGIVVLDVAR